MHLLARRDRLDSWVGNRISRPSPDADVVDVFLVLPSVAAGNLGAACHVVVESRAALKIVNRA